MDTGTEFGLSNIEQIALPVQDVERAVEYYRTKLGMKYLFSSNGLAFFDCGGVRLMLSKPENPEFDHPGSIIYFKVEEIHQDYETLSRRGVAFVGQPHRIADMGSYDLWMAFFHDSEQNTLAISGQVLHQKSPVTRSVLIAEHGEGRAVFTRPVLSFRPSSTQNS